MNIHIPHINFSNHNRKSLFILTRPFYTESGWKNDKDVKNRWQVSDDFHYTSLIEKADVLFIPNPVNTYSKIQLAKWNEQCLKYNIKGYGYISGDLGKACPPFSNLIYFRMGGFKSQLDKNNIGFPVILSDYYEKFYNKTDIEIRSKQEKPVVGFCGHANFSILKQLRENLVFIRENSKRFLQKPYRNDYEPLFASAYQRASLLRIFENSIAVNTNFIYRKQYRAGAVSAEEKGKTTREYYENIRNSDYILCVRGAGNFSVRLYETLMMGRIPIFVNTDCLLPFEEEINWKNHVVWVEWKDRKNIVEILSEFHQNISG